jgi:hypothetical protein
MCNNWKGIWYYELLYIVFLHRSHSWGTAETDCLTHLLFYVCVLCSLMYSVGLNICWFLVVYTRNMEQTQNGGQILVLNLMGIELQYKPYWLFCICLTSIPYLAAPGWEHLQLQTHSLLQTVQAIDFDHVLYSAQPN